MNHSHKRIAFGSYQPCFKLIDYEKYCLVLLHNRRALYKRCYFIQYIRILRFTDKIFFPQILSVNYFFLRSRVWGPLQQRPVWSLACTTRLDFCFMLAVQFPLVSPLSVHLFVTRNRRSNLIINSIAHTVRMNFTPPY